MGKEFKNIDELFRSTVGTGTAKAPKAVKAKIMSATGGGYLWVIGAILLFITAIGAVTISLNMKKNKVTTKYDLRFTDPAAMVDDSLPAKINKSNLSQYQPSKNQQNQGKSVPDDTALTENNERNFTDSNTEFTRSTAKKSPEAKIDKKVSFRDKLATNSISANLPPNVHSSDKQNTTAKASTNKEFMDEQMASKQVEKTTKATDYAATLELESNSARSQLASDRESEQKATKVLSNSINNANNTPTESAKEKETYASDSIVGQVDKSQVLANKITATYEPTDPAVEQVIPQNLPDISLNETEEKTEIIKQNEIEIENETNLRKSFWLFGADLGSNINSANYGNSELGASLAKFNSEKLGFQTQVYSQYNHLSNFTFGTGVGFEQQSYRNTLVTNNFSYNVETNITVDNYIFDSTGVLVDSVYTANLDTVSTTISGINSINDNTKLQYLQIPVRIGYQIKRNKWLIGADLGIQLNYLYKASGKYVLDNTIKDLGDKTTLKRTTINYQIGATAKYNLARNVYLSGVVRFTPSLQNYFDKEYGTRGLNTLSLGIGIAVKL